jgi:aspartate/methionine/tyrosine aminotransferase
MSSFIHIATADRIAQVEEYYFSRKLAEVRGLDTPALPVINLGIGSPDLAPAPDTIEALHTSARNPAHHGYQSYKGTTALREGIAAFSLRTYGVKLNAEQEILPLMGSKEGIMHITLAFVNPGEEVLIPNPGYPTYASVSKIAGAKVREYTLREDANWSVDVAELRKQDLSNVKLMWVNYPHMPTGATLSGDELAELVALAREKNFLIVNDNPYSLILNDSPQSILAVPGAHEVAMELNSLSKSHNMAGWRIGWAAGNKDFIDAMLRVKSNMDSGMFLGLQHAAVEALKNETDWFEGLNNIYLKRSRLVRQLLDELGCRHQPKQSGLFVWAKAPDSISDVESWLNEILYDTHVFITPGFIFGDAGKRYVRVSLCASEEKLQIALARVQGFVAKRNQSKSKAQLA